MAPVLDYTPIAAAAFAIPQFLPQLVKLARTADTNGLSWPWATLTCINNLAWTAYFVLSGFWTALIPSISATLLAGTLAILLARRRIAAPGPATAITGWAVLLAVACIVNGRAGLGTLLIAAFAIQVTPSIWTAYRTAAPTGISAGTWLLVLGELSCWTVYGLHRGDPRLIMLGLTGITAATLMVGRITRTRHLQARAVADGDHAAGFGRFQADPDAELASEGR